MSAVTPAVAAAQRASVDHRLHRYDVDPRATSFGDDAVDHLAAALGVDPGQIFKTLVIAVTGSSGPTLGVAVLPVPFRLSTKHAAAALGASRAELAEPDAVRRSTGYVLGGVSPIGQRRRLPTVVDSSAARWPVVLCSAGRRGLEIELAPDDLIALTGAVVADICS